MRYVNHTHAVSYQNVSGRTLLAVHTPTSMRVRHRYFMSQVLANGPAHKCIKAGDELITIDGRDVGNLDIKALIALARYRGVLVCV